METDNEQGGHHKKIKQIEQVRVYLLLFFMWLGIELERTMQAEQYFDVLKSIEEKIEILDVNTLNQLLEQTFEVKPVRLKWYLLKAQVMLKEGKEIAEIKDFLVDKCAPWYVYESVDEYFQLLSVLSEIEGDTVESQRYLYHLAKATNSVQECAIIDQELDDFSVQLMEKEILSEDDMLRLADLYYISGDIYLYMLWVVAARKKYNCEEDIRSWILQGINVEYYYDRLIDKEAEVFAILLAPEQDNKSCLLAMRALEILGKKPILVEECDKAEEILEDISKNQTDTEILTVMGSGLVIDELAMSKTIKPKLERLTEAQYDYMEDNIAIGRYGNYFAYMARIYKTTREDLERLLYRKPSCAFSIIIPCRNATETLIGTLKTCLEQSFQGDYEVLVSDNSNMDMGEDTPTKRMCEEFQDSRIRYIRTPRNLPLAKNFEYAYLNSEGEFLISMGSDDGILPWALEELNTIIAKYPQQQVILWHEAFYKWADVDARIMKDAGKATLRVSHPYKKGSPDIHLYDAQEIFQKAFEHYGMLYYLPQIYHNCGIHRCYLQNFYERTGILWAGGQQDIYMAVANGNLLQHICMVENLFTITGISNNSIGANARRGNTDYRQVSLRKKMQNTLCQGYHVRGYTERMFPTFGTELGVFYSAMLCVHQVGIISDEVIERADWKKMFERVMEGMSVLDILFERKWNWMRYVISLHGDDLLDWFDKNYYFKRLEPIIVRKTESQSTNIHADNTNCVIIENEAMQIDQHDIDTVYGASQCIQRIYDR